LRKSNRKQEGAIIPRRGIFSADVHVGVTLSWFLVLFAKSFFLQLLSSGKLKTEYESSSLTKEKKQTSPCNAPLAISVHDF